MMPTTPGAALLRRLYVTAASLAACAVVDARSSVHLTCDNNLRINPPEGGSVEIGKLMSVDTGGSINSAQMKEFSEKMARMEGGLATATANIAVLTEDNVALKADNANFATEISTLKQDKAALVTRVGDLEAVAATTQAALATLTSGYANLTSDVAALTQDKAALMDQVSDLKAAAAAVGSGDDSVSSSYLDAVKAELETLKNETVQVNTTVTTTLSQVGDLEAAAAAADSRVSALAYQMSIQLGESNPRLLPVLLTKAGSFFERSFDSFDASNGHVDGFYLEYLIPGTYHFEVKGAAGAQYNVCKGGKGVTISAMFSSDAPMVLLIAIGHHTVDSNVYSRCPLYGRGGGGTFISLNDFETPLFAAGGGGGASHNSQYSSMNGVDASTSESGTYGSGTCNWPCSGSCCRSHGPPGQNGQEAPSSSQVCQGQGQSDNTRALAFVDFTAKRGKMNVGGISGPAAIPKGGAHGQPGSGYSGGGQACIGGVGGGGGTFAHADATSVTITADNSGAASVKITRL